MKLKKGELPPLTGIFTRCKICKETKDDAYFKYQHGKRVGLVCRKCDAEAKRVVHITEEERLAKNKIRKDYYYSHKKEAAKQAAKWREANQERIKERRISYHLEKRDSINARSLDWYYKNKQYSSEKGKAYYEINKVRLKEAGLKNYRENKQQYKDRMRLWRIKNPHLINYYVRNYNLSKVNRTPHWANKLAINSFYRNCPDGSSVDHIHPLNGKLISGFHVETNLQYMTRIKNSEKSNKFNTYWVFYEPSRIRIETSGSEASIYSVECQR